MFSLRVHFIFAWCFTLGAVLELTTGSDCDLYYYQNAPIIQRNFGYVEFYQNYPYANDRRQIPLSNGETITAFCADKFKVYDYNRYSQDILSNQIKVQCTENRLVVLSPENTDINYEFSLSCPSLEYGIFESNETLPGCNDYKAYSISPKSIPKLNFTSIGLCFDWKNLNIIYAKYISYQSTYYFLNNDLAKLPNVIEADTEIFNLDTLFGDSFMGENTFNSLYERKKIENSLLGQNIYVYKTLLQDEKAGNRYTAYDKLFNIVWWQNLMENNWRSFLNEFIERNQDVTYMIYTGVSGVVTLPKTNALLKFQNSGKSVNAPAHIWMYLKSLKEDVVDEFVIVAHNTPFHKTGATHQLCEDICHEIDWLKNSTFVELHLMPLYGVVNCCRYEDVYKKLEHFPIENKKLEINEHQISTESNNVN